MKNKNYIRLIFFVLVTLLVMSRGLYAETVWVSDRGAGNLVRISSDGKKTIIEPENFQGPVAIEVDQRDGSVWVTDISETFNNQVIKLSPKGKELFRLTGFVQLCDAAIDPKDGSYYASECMIGEVVKISSSGEELLRIKNLSPVEDLEGMGCLEKTEGCHQSYMGTGVNLESIDDIDISPVDSSVWVADPGQKRLLKFTKGGRKIIQRRGIGEPEHLTVGPDGSCWLNNIERRRVFKVSRDGRKILAKITDIDTPFELSVSPVDLTCWVTTRSQLMQISFDGSKILRRIGGFKTLQGISTISPYDGSFWVADFKGGAVIKFSRDGEALKRIEDFREPRFLEVYWSNSN